MRSRRYSFKTRRGRFWLVALVACAGAVAASADTHYVWTNSPSAVAPYTNWNTAAHAIQDAVDAAAVGELVLVTNGIYGVGTRVTPGYACPNRLVITNDIVVQSVEGPDYTFINGTTDVRCVYMGAGMLSGFTLANGDTLSAGNTNYDMCGGGINMYLGVGAVSNCVITGNSAASHGGGTYYGAVIDCSITGNIAADYGGGTFGGSVDGCIITGNTGRLGGGTSYSTISNSFISGNNADSGGGIIYGTVSNCRILDNSAINYGGGVYNGTLKNCTIIGNNAIRGGGTYNGTAINCILFYNQATINSNVYNTTVDYSCVGSDPGGTGNITNAPQLNIEARLMSNSPCIDAGTDIGVPAVDMDGEARWDSTNHVDRYTIVDIGADEYVDDDEDTIPDFWEKEYVLNPNWDDSAQNYDHDELNNIEEYLADTDPHDTNSLLRVVSTEAVGGDVLITWQGGTWARQVLQVSTDLVNGAWVPCLTNNPPTTATSFLVKGSSNGVRQFYRVRADRQ